MERLHNTAGGVKEYGEYICQRVLCGKKVHWWLKCTLVESTESTWVFKMFIGVKEYIGVESTQEVIVQRVHWW